MLHFAQMTNWHGAAKTHTLNYLFIAQVMLDYCAHHLQNPGSFRLYAVCYHNLTARSGTSCLCYDDSGLGKAGLLG